jgi:serine/threonine protein kinase
LVWAKAKWTRATWKQRNVVVKVPIESPGKNEWAELFSMLDLPEHEHVLPLLGICRDFRGLQFNAFCLVTEFQTMTLKTHVEALFRRANALPSPDKAPSATTTLPSTVLRVLSGMAKGLAHLHKHAIVHRDVALRNFLTARDGRVLICDFGLSRQLQQQKQQVKQQQQDAKQSYYSLNDQSALPIRWLSPEALLTHKFTLANDVWMFAVAAWEVLTAGQLFPYHTVNIATQVLCGVCAGTLRLAFPAYVPPQLRALLASCMSKAPHERPTIQQIVLKLDALMAATCITPVVASADAVDAAGDCAAAAAAAAAAAGADADAAAVAVASAVVATKTTQGTNSVQQHTYTAL